MKRMNFLLRGLLVRYLAKLEAIEDKDKITESMIDCINFIIIESDREDQ